MATAVERSGKSKLGDNMAQLYALFDQIHEKMADSLRGYVRRRLLPAIWSQCGEDIIQESFIRLMTCWECRGDGQQIPSLECALGELRPLLYKITFRVMQEAVREFKRQEHDGMDVDAVAAEGQCRFGETENRLQTAKSLCSGEEWEILEWIAFEKPSSREIGERIGLTPQKARAKIHRLRRRLREAIKREAM